MSFARPQLLTLALLALAAMPMSGCNRSGAAAPGAASPMPTVTAVHPEKSTVQDYMEYTGRVEPFQKVEVRSRVSGYLESIAFRDGQQVKVGDPLFVIDQRPFVVARDRAQASLAQAVARRKLAAAELERATHLHGSGFSSTENLDRARSEFETAEAAVKASEAELRSAELELSFATVRAPISGRASDHRADIGNYLAGGTAQADVLTTIVTQSPVRVVVELSEADFRRLRQQAKFPEQVQLSLDGSTDTHMATVDFVDNEVSSRSGTLRLRASFDNADQTVVPGYFARVRIPVGAPQERLLVPDAAIDSDQTKKLVFVVDAAGQVAARQVELGGLVGSKRVVLSGLTAEDQVIVSGAQRVRPGDRVQLAALTNH